MNWLLNLDYQLFSFLNGLASKNSWFDALVIVFAYWAAFLLPVWLLVWGILNRRNINLNKYIFSLVASAVAARLLLVEIIRFFIVRARPYLAHDGVNQLILKGGEPSFPSGHTAPILAVGVVLLKFNKTVGWLVIVLAILVGLSRVVAGVHYPSDILGGALVGWLCGLIIVKLFKLK